MANFHSGGTMGFDAGVYIPPPPDTVSYLQQTANNFHGRLDGFAANMYQSMADKIASFNYENLAYMAQAVYRMADGLWLDNRIQPLQQIGHFQNAPQSMVRWLMAEPTIRQLYHNGEAEGYGENYIDRCPNDIGETHHDWQIVNDGVFDTEDDMDVTNEYFYDSNPQYDPEFDELNIHDVTNIMSSWKHMAAFAKAKRDDPTSKWNGRL